MMISIIFYNEEEQDDLFICLFYVTQEEGRSWAGGNLLTGSSEVIRVRGVEPPCDSHQETGCWVSEAAEQNWRVSFRAMRLINGQILKHHSGAKI